MKMALAHTIMTVDQTLAKGNNECVIAEINRVGMFELLEVGATPKDFTIKVTFKPNSAIAPSAKIGGVTIMPHDAVTCDPAANLPYTLDALEKPFLCHRIKNDGLMVAAIPVNYRIDNLSAMTLPPIPEPQADAIYQDDTLVWEKTRDSLERTWERSKDYCAQLHSSGVSGWVVPTIDDLSQIASYFRKTVGSAGKGVNAGGVGNSFWSRTEIDANDAWYYDFDADTKAKGAKSAGPGANLRPLCVWYR